MLQCFINFGYNNRYVCVQWCIYRLCYLCNRYMQLLLTLLYVDDEWVPEVLEGLFPIISGIFSFQLPLDFFGLTVLGFIKYSLVAWGLIEYLDPKYYFYTPINYCFYQFRIMLVHVLWFLKSRGSFHQNLMN